VPAALKLKEEYGDDLQIIFAESQNSGYENSVRFALKTGWLEHDVIWSSDYIFSTGSRGLPSFALLDANGTVVLKGSSTSLKGKMEDEIERMVKEAGSGPAGIPKSVSKIYAELGKGSYAKAMTAANKLKAKPGSKDADMVVSATEASMVAITAGFHAELARADWLLNNGYPIRAQVLVKGLVKGVKGNADMTAKLEPYLTKFDGDAMKAQLSAAKSLAKLESKMYADKNGEKVAEKLVKLANENASNPIGKRASILAKVAGGTGLVASAK
jgi:hypothetical protein